LNRARATSRHSAGILKGLYSLLSEERITVKGKNAPLNPSEIFSKLNCFYDKSVLILIHTVKNAFFTPNGAFE
jgi:hypothetical protein